MTQNGNKICTDASNLGLGESILQKHGSKWLTVDFASRAMTHTEQNYCKIIKKHSVLCLDMKCSINFSTTDNLEWKMITSH